MPAALSDAVALYDDSAEQNGGGGFRLQVARGGDGGMAYPGDHLGHLHRLHGRGQDRRRQALRDLPCNRLGNFLQGTLVVLKHVLIGDIERHIRCDPGVSPDYHPLGPIRHPHQLHGETRRPR